MMNQIIHTEIVGDFLGWRNDAIYMLGDGSCWRIEPGGETHAFFREPLAVLIKTDDAFFLQVPGESRRKVTRVEAHENGHWWNEYIGSDHEAAATLLNMIQSATYRDVMANAAVIGV